MKKVIEALASLKLTVGLLIVSMVILATGTIVESLKGTEAGRAVYYSPWFFALLGLFAVNLLAALVERWPWGKLRIGFALTHGAIVLIFVGSAMTYFWKTEGQLALWEGEARDRMPLVGSEMGDELFVLPFTVRLDDFQIDVYPGTGRPAMFRSRVTVSDGATGEVFPAVIQMNQELTHRGFSLFQSSYQQVQGREMTVLSVSSDPGQPVVFLGYILLVAGMATVLGTRIVQRRRFLRLQEGAPVPPAGSIAAALVLALFFGGMAAETRAQSLPDLGQVARLRALPVQHDGRTMPLDTVARETVWNVTGKIRWQGHDPVSLLLAWSTEPAYWVEQPLVKIGSKELGPELGVAAGARHASFRSITENPRFRELVQEARTEQQQDRKISGILEDAVELEGRLVKMHAVLTGRAYTIRPTSEDPIAAWRAPGQATAADLERELEQLRTSTVPAHYPTGEAILRELRYNRVDPSRLAWWILVPVTLLALVSWLRPHRNLDLLTIAGLIAGFAVMSWGIGMRWQIAGRIPASNMYESLLFLGWGVGLFALVVSIFLRNRLILFNAAAMSALTMLLTDQLPVDRFIHPMPPVLSGTPWLAIHVPIIMVSYSVLALGVLVAHMQVGIEIFRPARRDLVAKANDLLYWYMHVGSLLLLVGILTGSIWAASSWGRYWGWDPKEVWSLVAFLAYMAILHGRFDRWLGPFGVAVASIAAFWSILMTYLGVNYVLASGLHSYGFGASGVVRAMVFWIVVEIVFLSIGFVARGRSRRGGLTTEA